MSDPTSWKSEWRALAEKELRGAPFSSLTPARHDGLAIEPALGPDVSRDEGLPNAPAARATTVVASSLGDAALVAGADGLWWRSAEEAPESGVLLIERPTDPVVVEVIESGGSTQSAVALTDVHESGGSAISEVAVGVAALIELAHRRGGAPDTFRFATSVGPELFVEIAKLRALRRLAGRVLGTLGIEGRVWIAARSAQRSLARLDVATNVVRGTLGAAAAMLGGADVIGVLPMDKGLASPSVLGARLARNVPQILARESGLLAVDDPARGSFEIEALTDRIARDAWEAVREIERAGGLVAARSLVRDRIARDAAARRAAVRSRRVPIVGVSKFPLAGDQSSASSDDRDAAPFELARSLPRVPVELVVIGAREAIEARVEFVRELLDVGGLDVSSVGRAAIVCAPDAAFTTEVPAALSALRARGVPAFVAGKPGANEAMLRAAGALGFIAMGQDVAEFFAAVRGAMR